MFEEALRKVREKGGRLWSLGERTRDGGSEWYASIHVTCDGGNFCTSGIAPTPEGAIEQALGMALRQLPSPAEVQAQLRKSTPGPTVKINL